MAIKMRKTFPRPIVISKYQKLHSLFQYWNHPGIPTVKPYLGPLGLSWSYPKNDWNENRGNLLLLNSMRKKENPYKIQK